MKKFKLIIIVAVATGMFITVYSKNQQQNSLSDLQKENIELMTTSDEPGIILRVCYSPDTGKVISKENSVYVCEKGTVCNFLPWDEPIYNGTTAFKCKKESFVSHMLYRRGHCYENVK